MKDLNKIIAPLAFAAIIASPIASAGTLITQWGYNLDSGFTTHTETGVGNASSFVDELATNANLGAPSMLEWGDPHTFSSPIPGTNGRSSIAVAAATNGNAAGVINTGAGPVNTVAISHTNNIIVGSSLLTATLLDVLTLNPLLPVPGAAFPGLPLIFDVNFTETPNDVLPCAVPQGANCADIFVLGVSGGAFNQDDPNNIFIQTGFVFDEFLYTVRLFVQGLGLLSDAACSAANTANGCIGLTTSESLVNTFDISFSIDGRPVSAPASLALLGLGLLGLGRLRRKA